MIDAKKTLRRIEKEREVAEQNRRARETAKNKELFKKPDVDECALKGCNRIGVLRFIAIDVVDISIGNTKPIKHSEKYCCKTHGIRGLQEIKLPRYSKKRTQQLAGTMPLKPRGQFKDGAGI